MLVWRMVLDALLERRLVILSGKGGVGKSVVGTALALAARARGKRTLLVEVDAPGLPDLMLLGKIMVLEEERAGWGRQPKYDLIVLDAPATGHGLAFLRVP